MTTPTAVPAKISRLVTEAQGAIFKIAEAIQAEHERKPIQGRYVTDDLEVVWDRVAAALNQASGYGVVLNLSVHESMWSDATDIRVRLDLPPRICQLREKRGCPQKLVSAKANPRVGSEAK
jgi:hypothetical protein